MQRSFKHKEASNSKILLPDILKLICALAAHRKFAALFVDRGGMQRLLSVQRNTQTFFGLSSCLFTIGSIQVILFRLNVSACLQLCFCLQFDLISWVLHMSLLVFTFCSYFYLDS